MEGKKYLDYDGLEKYHSQIKQYINDKSFSTKPETQKRGQNINQG